MDVKKVILPVFYEPGRENTDRTPCLCLQPNFFSVRMVCKVVKVFFFLVLMMAPFMVLKISAQKPTQNIRGVVMDSKTRDSLPGATILLLGEDEATISDTEGNFLLENIPVGRYYLQVSYVGYESVIIPELLINSGDEVILDIEMETAFAELEEVVVKPRVRKDRSVNSMATVSARTFSVEEAMRYAGALDDPGRMAGNFAGVTSAGVHVNAIVVRGNAPKGLSWRLEGVDIPVPSHFSGSNVAGGGGLTMFSSQMLTNSDFFTGAFPAEYGNATAGVFDMKMRNGNTHNNEYAFQVGVQGIEAAAEGPFKKEGSGSYLLNYRYSTMALIFPLLPEVRDANELPVYQDLAFKIHLPSKKAGNFSLWGMGGLSHTKMDGYDDAEKWVYAENRAKMRFHYNMGVAGIRHSKRLSDNTYLRSTIAISGREHAYDEKSRLDTSHPGQLSSLFNVVMTSGKASFLSKLTHVFNSRFTLMAGIDAGNEMYRLQGDARDFQAGEIVQILNGRGNSWLAEGFLQGKYRVHQNFHFTGGINASWFQMNGDYSLDPRLSAAWQFLPEHRLTIGYGNHRQTEPLFVYFATTSQDQSSGELNYPNKDLKRMGAHHFVLGYDWSVTDNLRLKIEPYYQSLYDVPVVDGTAYSMVNFMSDWTFNKPLVNSGTATNMGIDITVERFLKEGYYFMSTASVYDSDYTGGDGISRRTRYDGGYVLNILGGKEWLIHEKNMLNVNLKMTFMGPYWHQNVDEAATRLKGEIVYDDNSGFSYRHSNLETLTDFTVSYRINASNTASLFSLQVRNILGKQYLGKKYNIMKQEIEDDFFSSPVPFVSYKLEF